MDEFQCPRVLIMKEELQRFISNSGPFVWKCHFAAPLPKVLISLYRLALIFKELHSLTSGTLKGKPGLNFRPFLLCLGCIAVLKVFVDMFSAVKAAFHISAFGWYAFIVNCLAAKDGEDLPAGIFVYGGPWKYLTFLNLLLQMTFFGLAAVNDLQPGKQTESPLKKCNDFLFSVFGFPVGMFVVVLFWTIFAYDRELVYPASIDSFFPPWINHAMHTFVLPISLGEVLVQPHTYPQRRHALAALMLVGLAYLSWILWVYVSVGVWVYPLLGHFSPAGLAAFFFFNMSVVTLLYALGDKLNNHVWSEKQSSQRSRQQSLSVNPSLFFLHSRKGKSKLTEPEKQPPLPMSNISNHFCLRQFLYEAQ